MPRPRPPVVPPRRRSGAVLRVTALEDRTTPATFTQVGTALNIDLTGASSNVTIQSTGTSYVLTLTGDTWTSADIGTDAVKSNGNATLTLTAASFPAVNLADSGAGVAVSFIPSTGAYSSDFTVTLDNAPGAVTFLGPANFGANDLTVDTSYQVAVLPGTTLTASTGDITFRANLQATPTAGNFDGILINPVVTLSITGSGNLTLEGRGGTNAIGTQRGVAILTMATVSGGTGTLTINGTGGASSGGFNHGVSVDGFSAQITSAGGNVSVNGTGGGDASSSSNAGVFVGNAGSIKAGGSGTVSVTGTGGAGIGSENNGVMIFNALTTITSTGGDIFVTGTAGGGSSAGISMGSSLSTITTVPNGGDITLTADSINLANATVLAGVTDAVTLRPLTAGFGVDLGGADSATALGLTDAELDLVTAGTLRVGAAGTGAITVTAPITRDGNVVLTGATVAGLVAGTDLAVGDGTLSFGPGTALASVITGTTPDTGYDQLSVTGDVDLSGVGVAVSGPFVAPIGTVFDLVTATGTVTGSFGPPTAVTLNGVALLKGTTATTGFLQAVSQPTTTGIPAQTANAGGPPATVDLSTVFAGGTAPITYAVVGNTGPGVATATVNGAILSLTGLAPGTTTITVRATDANGLFVDTTVTVTVAAPQTGTPAFSTSGPAGAVTVRNPDGSPRYTTPAVGDRSAVADFNRDGVPDVVVVNGPGRRAVVTVVDGATGATLLTLPAFEDTFTGGAFVAAGDVTGDGVPDIAVSADTTGSARVTVFDGATGAVLADFFGIDDPNFRGGARVALGDVDGDGLADLIVAAGVGGGPRVALYSGATLRPGMTPVRLVADFFVFEPSQLDGVFVAAGDVNGDGFADLVFGGGPGGGPRVSAWDGAALLADFFAADPALRNGVSVAAHDLDGDGRADLLAGVPVGTGGVVRGYLASALAPVGTPPAFLELDPGVGGAFVG